MKVFPAYDRRLYRVYVSIEAVSRFAVGLEAKEGSRTQDRIEAAFEGRVECFVLESRADYALQGAEFREVFDSAARILGSEESARRCHWFRAPLFPGTGAHQLCFEQFDPVVVALEGKPSTLAEAGTWDHRCAKVERSMEIPSGQPCPLCGLHRAADERLSGIEHGLKGAVEQLGKAIPELRENARLRAEEVRQGVLRVCGEQSDHIAALFRRVRQLEEARIALTAHTPDGFWRHICAEVERQHRFGETCQHCGATASMKEEGDDDDE